MNKRNVITFPDTYLYLYRHAENVYDILPIFLHVDIN